MATTLGIPEHNAGYAWYITWTGTANFDIYDASTHQYIERNTEATELYYEGSSATEPPVIVVADSTEDITGYDVVKYNRRPVIQWRGHKTADYYLVERYNGATWDEVGKAYESGLGYYQLTDTARSYYDDAGTLRYRVTVVDTEGSTAEIVNIDYFVFGVPDAPSITMTYAGGNVTIAAA